MELVESNQPTININMEALEEWTEYRVEKKKPLSKLALKKTQNLLLKLGYEHQQHCVDVAIQNDWVGLHPVEMPRQIGSPSRDRTLQQDLTDTSWAYS
jgi:hypothetical protein